MLTLLLCDAHSLPGRVISVVEGSPICHVALDLGLACGVAVAEEPSGLWLRPTEQYLTARRWPLSVSDTQATAILAWLWQRVGSAYDYAVIVVDAVALLAHVHLPVPANGNRYDCSGVIAEACTVAGYAPFAPRDPRTVTPADWTRLAGI